MNGVSNCANAAKDSLAHSQVAQTNNITNCSSETGQVIVMHRAGQPCFELLALIGNPQLL